MAESGQKLITSKDVQQWCNDWVESQKNFTYTDETSCKRKQTDDDESYNTDSEFDSVSECGAKRRRVGLPLKREVFHLSCEWPGCEYEINHVEKFVNHVAEHVSDLGIRTNEKGIDVYVCQWSGCFYESNDRSRWNLKARELSRVSHEVEMHRFKYSRQNQTACKTSWLSFY